MDIISSEIKLKGIVDMPRVIYLFVCLILFIEASCQQIQAHGFLKWNDSIYVNSDTSLHSSPITNWPSPTVLGDFSEVWQKKLIHWLCLYNLSLHDQTLFIVNVWVWQWKLCWFRWHLCQWNFLRGRGFLNGTHRAWLETTVWGYLKNLH